MKIAKIESWPINIPYKHMEKSALVARSGVTDLSIKITTDSGLVGWGESTRVADVFGIQAAIKAMTPIVLGRSPWNREAICRDIFDSGPWLYQEMTANLAYAGIDMALWDLCGKEVGKPLYQLFGGAMREEVNYFYYLTYTDLDSVREQCEDGVKKGFSVFYVKVGINAEFEEQMLRTIRQTIGSKAKLRIDTNQAWSPLTARRLLNRWHEMFDLDFAEAPTRIEPLEIMHELKRQTPVALCANEGMWRAEEVHRIIASRAVDFLCFSPYWVGSISTFLRLCHLADFHGIQVVKHTHGEYGIAAAVCQHLMLAIPNAAEGHQQTAYMMAGDVIKGDIPISTGPTWGMIESPGIGFEVDEKAVKKYHEAFLKDGPFIIYGDKFPVK